MIKPGCLSIILFLSINSIYLVSACGSCLASSVVGARAVGRFHNHKHFHGYSTLPSTTKSALAYLTWKQLSTHVGYNLLTKDAITRRSISYPYKRRQYLLTKEESNIEHDSGKENLNDNENSRDGNDTEGSMSKPDDMVVSASMVGTIGFYKNFISPLLPPACRFLPTCSQYGVQAIEEFGPSKGVALIAWRLLRCSPFGGRGYDPPKWPPVSYTYGSY
mmetsp:Transcript_270/g.365  ORF Transcript_270/g.365 Transcript_270/m.365 type:complete len:219 (+) Transcript_270:79-735(+)